ncbi:DUF4303 domain-containing protein [Erysipelothrix sp. HDW6A]|uniref:DUF4303 domain-containing protein n=1 Tax=Erysipelothrix sp. HDW6A TaxID=2714928 RepID=UPI00140ACED0|nr:DUF4303 domain-containing protein [Erysipelothrix sp. HDW6A]QIK57504.1 DUF4303 domain-containing protein [Erysipelothrix sp. HDW6A]
MAVSRRTVVDNYRKNLYDETLEQLRAFCEDHQELTFYGIAFEVDSQTWDVVVSLNTEFDFYRQRMFHQENTDKDLSEIIKYDTRTWNYQAIVRCKPVEEQLMQKYFANDHQKVIDYTREVSDQILNTCIKKRMNITDDFENIIKVN